MSGEQGSGLQGVAEVQIPKEIVATLERGATVITGNQRAARSLRMGWDRRNRELGLRSWQPTKVMSWDTWLSGWWGRMLVKGQATRMLLNRSQELAVWRGILEDWDSQSLRSSEALAEMAADAWQSLCNYRAQDRLRELAVSTDTKAFQRWAMAFERYCVSESVVAQAGLEEALSTAVAERATEVRVSEIVLVGMDRLNPAQAGLVEALRDAGVGVDQLPLKLKVAEKRLLVKAQDEAEELRACALWLRRLLREEPGAKVGVIVPGLAGLRDAIDRVFREVLAPEAAWIGFASDAVPYEFSIGSPLAMTAMVRCALDVLRWVEDGLPLERVSGLLLSPYFGGGRKELRARAEFDAFELRRTKMLRPEVSVERLAAMVTKTKVQGLDGLEGALQGLQQLAGRWFAKDALRFHAEWVEAMRELLAAVGWGAGESEESGEFQTRAKWESALDELAALDFRGERLSYGEAVGELERIARRTVFAVESREAPVQVMGPLEAAGSWFDAVWFLRAGELDWPMQVASSPLLPWQMQRELRMPGSDAAKEAAFARAVTERIARSTKTLICSYAAESSEGRQRSSEMVAELGLEEIEAGELVALDESRVVVKLESVPDNVVVQPLPDAAIPGGAAVLQLQAACAFRAFAERRLGSTELESVELGMDAGESGNVIHKVMEVFWGRVQSQEALRAMTVVERGAVLDQAIVRGLEKMTALSASVWDAAYLDMQYERLRRLLTPWLEEELSRPAFTVKQREESAKDVQIGPLRLNVRLDRVDETAGGELVIDYKTGAAATNDWLTARPDAPQLPLYAVVSDRETLGGVAFGRLRVGKDMGWKGFAAREGVLTKSAGMEHATFEEQLEGWREVLTDLAEQFAAGDARVDPKIYPKTCEHCGQQLLCRVAAASLDETEEDVAVGDE